MPIKHKTNDANPFLRIYKGIQENVNKKGPFFKDLFAYCHKYKLYWLRKGFYTPLLDAIIYRQD